MKVPLKQSNVFRLASVSKHFAAVLALLRQEKGLVEINKPISAYIAKFKDRPIGNLTLYNLLTNTGGVPNDMVVWDYANLKIQKPFTADILIDGLLDTQLEFKPGEKWNYSNTGFVLAGAVMEKAVGKSYEELLKEHIFSPLGMKNTAVDHAYEFVNERTNNYEILVNGDIRPAQQRDLYPVGPAAGVHSNLEDLSIWLKALFIDKKVLNEKSLELLTKPFFGTITTSSKQSYAMGLNNVLVKDENGTKEMHVITHDGIISGVRAAIGFFPEYKAYFIVLSNTGEGYRLPFSFNTDDLMKKFGSIFYGYPYALKKRSVAVQFYKKYKAGTLKEAEVLAERLKKDSDNYVFLENEFLGIGRDYLNKKHYEKAKEVFFYALKNFPNSANINYYLGETFEGNSESEKALVYYEAAYKLKEDKELLEKIKKLKVKQ